MSGRQSCGFDPWCRQSFFNYVCLRFVLKKAIFRSHNSSWLFQFFKLFFKKFRINNVLCLDFLYQSAHWNSPESRRFDLPFKICRGSTPRTLILSELSLTVRNIKRNQSTPLFQLVIFTSVYCTVFLRHRNSFKDKRQKLLKSIYYYCSQT